MMFNTTLKQFFIFEETDLIDTGMGYCEGPIIENISLDLNYLVRVGNALSKAEWLPEHEIHTNPDDRSVLDYKNIDVLDQSFLDYINLNSQMYNDLYAKYSNQSVYDDEYVDQCKEYLTNSHINFKNTSTEGIIKKAHILHDDRFPREGILIHQDGKGCYKYAMSAICDCEKGMYYTYNIDNVDWLKTRYLNLNSLQGIFTDDLTKKPFYSSYKDYHQKQNEFL